MKKILLILSIVFSLALTASAGTVGIFAVPDATTAFGKIKATDTIVFNKSTGELFKLIAKASASDTLSTASSTTIGGYSGGDIEIGAANSLAIGPIADDGTWRIRRDGTDLIFEEKVSGVYIEKSRIQNSFYVADIHLGEDLTLTAAGPHLRIASKGMPTGQEGSMLLQVPYGDTGSAAPIVPLLGPLETGVIIQPDDSGEFTGQTFEFGAEFDYGQIVHKLYFKTGATVPTDFITFKFYFGSDTSGDLFYKNKMRADAFPVNSTIEIDIGDVLGMPENTPMHAELTSSTDFSFKTNAAGTDLWFAFDRYKDTHDNVAYAPGWSAKTWTIEDIIVEGGLFYECNTTGDQTADFETNAALWDKLGASGGEMLWDKTGTTLSNKSGVSTFEFNDGARDRIIANDTENQFVSPGGIEKLTMSDTTYHLGSTNDSISQNNNSFSVKSLNQLRLVIDTGNLRLYPPNMAGHLRLPNGSMTYNDGTRDRFTLSTAGTFIYDERASNPGYLFLENEMMTLSDGTSARLQSDNLKTMIIGPGNGAHLDARATSAEINDGTRDRVIINSTHVQLVGASGARTLTVSDNGGTVSSGPIVAEDKYFFLGDPNTDGTYRIWVDGTSLKFDLRASGVYNTVGSFAP